MRKSLLIALVLIMIFAVGCDEAISVNVSKLDTKEEDRPIGNPDIDFKSVLDTETGMIFSLGDSKGFIDSILGSYDYDEHHDWYSYVDCPISIKYDARDTAIAISVFPLITSRFEFRDARFDMTLQEVEGYFILFWSSSYRKFYDSDGNSVEEEDAECYAYLYFCTTFMHYIIAHIDTH
jgi:hypothetical protein